LFTDAGEPVFLRRLRYNLVEPRGIKGPKQEGGKDRGEDIRKHPEQWSKKLEEEAVEETFCEAVII
jgi:hypothetical protein